MSRKIMALTMALILAFGVAVNAAYFTDMQNGDYDWAKDTINKLADQGIIKGYSDGTYGPAKEITRQEAFTLFARAAGVNHSYNAYAVEFNQYAYKEVADKYNTYAKKELCFLLERGILTEDEAAVYLSDENKDKVMLRHEAAVLISEILGIRGAFDEDGEYILDFTDINDIPEESMAAVGFANEKGILSGMSDGSFSPNTGVTRAQIAIMLDRIIDNLQISYVTGVVTNIDKIDENVLEIDEKEYKIDEHTVCAINGENCDCDDIIEGDNATLVLVSTGAWAIDITRPGELVFESVKGTVKSISSSYITLANGQQYNVSAFFESYENGVAMKTDEINYTYPVELQLVNGFVRRLDSTGNLCKYEDAKILSITTLPEEKLVIETDGEEAEYVIASDAVITKNGFETAVKDLSTKDLAYLLVEDGIIKEIGMYADFKENAASIKQIVIDEVESSILLKIGNGERFKIEENTEFLKEDNSKISIYDLRIGDTVKASFEKGKLAQLKQAKYIPPTSFGGEIVSVDVKKGIIEVDTGDEIRKIKITSSTSMVKFKEAEKLTIDELEEESYVVVDGEFEDDEFVAISIIL